MGMMAHPEGEEVEGVISPTVSVVDLIAGTRLRDTAVEETTTNTIISKATRKIIPETTGRVRHKPNRRPSSLLLHHPPLNNPRLGPLNHKHQEYQSLLP